MNPKIQERCEVAEAAGTRVQELTAAIVEKWRRMRKEGVLYSKGERKADSDALEEASEQYHLISESVDGIEDTVRS